MLRNTDSNSTVIAAVSGGMLFATLSMLHDHFIGCRPTKQAKETNETDGNKSTSGDDLFENTEFIKFNEEFRAPFEQLQEFYKEPYASDISIIKLNIDRILLLENGFQNNTLKPQKMHDDEASG